ncbi:MAG TPA: hypothetical protein VN181_02795, partial [Thermoanaerobaculia bacterium]|nr:hypothetical protein [Thermoanaerobaculia bacterium]
HNLWVDAALRARLAGELRRDFDTLLRKSAPRERGHPSADLQALKGLGYTTGSDRTDPRLIVRLRAAPDDPPYGGTGWEQTPAGPCVDATTIESDAYLTGDWYDANANGRWTGEGPAAVLLPRFAGTLSVQGANHGPNDVTVDFSIGGTIRATTTVAGKHPLAVTFPVAAGAEPLVITARTTFRPSDYGSSDKRRLGVSINEICVK